MNDLLDMLMVDVSTDRVITIIDHGPHPSAGHVYFCWSTDDELLYIGSTNNLERRVQEHRRTKWWWNGLDRIEGFGWPTIEEARAQERAAIAEHKPTCNYDPAERARIRRQYMEDDAAEKEWSVRQVDQLRLLARGAQQGDLRALANLVERAATDRWWTA